jgi:NAD(P)H-hydrate repair Nnr-like enzyme with NAD(P)H-hydrate dehydratase domain
MRPARHGLMQAMISSYLFCAFCCAAVNLTCGALTRAQNSTTEQSGMWTASVGSGQVMRGTWRAQISQGNPNAARGSWSLLNDASEMVLEGTWSVRKMGKGWDGSWTARAGNGRSLSGTWSAALADFKGNTLQEMLALTIQKQIGGEWQSGHYQGNWWLEGAGKKGRH